MLDFRHVLAKIGVFQPGLKNRSKNNPSWFLRWLQRHINKSNIIFCKFDFEFKFEFDFAFELEFEFDFALEFEFEFDFAFELEFEFDFAFEFEFDFALEFKFEFELEFEFEFDFAFEPSSSSSLFPGFCTFLLCHHVRSSDHGYL